MKILITGFLCFFFLHSFGQVTGKFITTGSAPIPFANVLLLKSMDSSLVKAALTDEKGVFRMEPIGAGQYILRFSAVG